MKIGVDVSIPSPLMGGGFTFEDEIVNALMGLRTESKHQFSLIAKRSQRARLQGDLGIPVLLVPPDLSERIGSRLGRWLPILRRLVSLQRQARQLQKLVDQSGIDLVWFVSPTLLTIDTPYITTVWDLQHN